MEISSKIGIFVIAIMLLVSTAACGGNDSNEADQTPNPLVQPTVPPVTPADKVTITIGNHTDMTGVAANAMEVLTKALEDVAQYYTDENRIPGVEFEVISYDGQYNPSMDIPGYEWLKENGADVIYSAVAATAVTLKPRLERDKMTLFTVAPNPEAFIPPGWVFATGNTCANWESQTLLKWIAENDPDFPKDRPAKIGGAFWNESYGISILDGAETYANAHPDQYEWEQGCLTDFSFVWTSPINLLKDCDYVFPPVPMNAFIQQWADSGQTAKFIGTDAHICFLKQIEDANLWDDIDGMLVVRPALNWTDEGDLIDLTKEIIYRYRPDEAESIIQWGPNYLSVQQLYIMFELIADTVEAVGAENFSSEALYETAQTFSITLDGNQHSYNETKRTSNDGLSVYKVRAAEKDVIWADNKWLPVIYEP